ncbi:MAG TPA: TOMM precursor leader peptide-binding protein [Solirubrobacterales bacterium]|nr:TOMM precursor leader peptide-binding protein [Solirubrobacterales bacterium]
MERPRIKRTTVRVESPQGDLYLLRGSASEDIHIGQPGEQGRRLLAALDGRRSRDELDAEFGAQEVGEVLDQLAQLGAIEDATDDDLIPDEVVARFDRQLRYFSDVTAGPTPSECQAKLENTRIAVLGVGGLGGWSALALACVGIGEMRLIDFDLVELNNLNRQVLYSEADIGRPKAEAAAERLGSFNSRMRLEVQVRRLGSEAEVAEAIEGCDVVIDAADWPAHDIERWINAACFAAGIPFIAMSHFPPFARIGPFYVPGQTGCYVCQEIAYRRSYPLFDLAVEQGRAQGSPAGTLGPGCGLIGNQVALDILHHLTGLAEPSSLGISHTYDLRTMELEREPVIPESNCPVCGHMQPARSAASDSFVASA